MVFVRKVFIYLFIFILSSVLWSTNPNMQDQSDEKIEKNSFNHQDFYEESIDSDSNLSLFEDSIIRHLISLGALYNKQITFVTIGFGVLIAVLFPQKTKSLVNSTKHHIGIYFEKIKKKTYFIRKKIRFWK